LTKRLARLALVVALVASLFILNRARGPASVTPGEVAPAVPAEELKSSPATAISPAALLEQGQHIFLRDCAHCHGPRGDGVSPNMRTLHPAPFDLTSFELTEDFVRRIVREGLAGTDMPGWSLGTEDEIRAVAAYTVTLGRPDALPESEQYAPPEALNEAGRRVYSMHCVKCHGEQGHGDGPEAAQHLPRPASFAEMRPSFAAARSAIANGVPGTAMPSWPLLTAPETQAVTFYIRSLYTNMRAVGAAGQ
jgi:mono/diheme cytochrome c family protein